MLERGVCLDCGTELIYPTPNAGSPGPCPRCGSLRRSAFGGSHASMGTVAGSTSPLYIRNLNMSSSPSSSTAGTAVMEPEVKPFANIYVEPLLDGLQATVVSSGTVVPLGAFGNDAHEHHKLSARAARAIARLLDEITDSTD